MALILSIAYLKVFIMAYRSIYGLRIFVFFINSLFMIVCMYIVVLLMLCQLISYSVIWTVLSCDFLTHNCLFMVDLILIIVFSTLHFMYLLLSVC
jgi:hypothetical protein